MADTQSPLAEMGDSGSATVDCPSLSQIGPRGERKLQAESSPELQRTNSRGPTLPREVLKQIVSFAMIAKDNGNLKMPCLTNATFRPSINLSCLLLDRDLYHAARQALYQDNTFAFSNFGSDIRIIDKSVGLLGCRRESCLQGGPPSLSNVVFNLGCTFNPERSQLRLKAFASALEGLRQPIEMENLLIQLDNYAWRSNSQVYSFCQALHNVKVSKQLTMKGLDVHLELNLRCIPEELGMSLHPKEYNVRFRGSGWQDLGSFECRYAPTRSISDPKTHEDPEANLCTSIDDPLTQYQDWLQAAEQSCVVNGLDYVTEFGYSSH